uniref:Rab-like protein 2A n=1 Tax=Fibrocapsa japonica TaxID=94617 RepID=A0A7S2XUJ5_9STRA|mmetsp:Transcript_10745/g.15933  ORF Transcript_10745/g.15933 Transcript_10745/m.15933 type:complete len:215 (+) Transcript_10745:130-774(+)|eukprot:CAMPEP_0113943750 /NCGR_PEP_ID=MMETSP1339-20121228/27304_1 /TAXON_ID=94617 /ORGANISM="Fibrocapsa japonica" /LENGTH=214 /DNA_ID=CAMNT_0000948695 /DNA_START=129 /DNA_END=773 /DNA_ORIENTATION=+ /assembly_acc=CAM_ASM_000762
MAEEKLEGQDDLPDPDCKVILLGDSAVGKSKLVERYLMNDFNPRQLSTFALTLYRKEVQLPEDDGDGGKDDGAKGQGGRTVSIDIWDTAGQERFTSMHPSYYYRAHACILVFDVTRKVTYQNLSTWYSELRNYCENIPVILCANKIDINYEVTKKSFKFASQHQLPFFFASAADGTNVVQIFESAVKMGVHYKETEGDFIEDALSVLGDKGSGK